MSFKLKTVLGIAFIEIILLAGLIISGLYYLRSSNEARILQQAHTSANLLATMATDATVAMDLASLDELVSQVNHNPGIDYIRIVGADQSILAEAGDEQALTIPFTEDIRIEDTHNDSRLDVFAPIQIEGYQFGRVEIGVSTNRLKQTENEARDWMLSIAALEIVLVAIFGLLLGQLLTSQLSRIREGARRVADGDFGAQITVKGRDELAETAASFNTMSESLRSYKEKFEQALELAKQRQALAETRLFAAIEAMPHGVAILEENGDLLHMNKQYRSLYDLPEDIETDGMPFTSIISLQAAQIEAQPYDRSLPVHETTVARKTIERVERLESPEAFRQWETKLKNGRVILCTQERISDGGLVLVDTEVTALHAAADREQELERELMQSQKLESLGTLAGGVAHEINTPTQYIGDNLKFLASSIAELFECIDTMEEKLKEDQHSDLLTSLDERYDLEYLRDELPTASDQAIKGVNRIRDIVAAVKVYSHPGNSLNEKVDINSIIKNAVLVTTNQWKYVANLTQSLDTNLPEVLGNEGQLSQVIVNILVNAADAIEEFSHETKSDQWSGEIHIETNSLFDEGIIIRISDNGPGIPTDVQSRIFDPFFTTKTVGKGSGQGLAISKSIIEDKHAGRITLESVGGKGTTFTVFLPLKSPSSQEEE